MKMNTGRKESLIKVAIIYFVMVFGIGFLLGPIRVLLLEPRVGTRTAELIEAPVMLVAIIVIARWVGRRWCRNLAPLARLGVGFLTVGMVLTADLVVGVGLRGMSAAEVFMDRDPVTGPIYYGLLGITAVAPWWFSRHSM